MCVPVPHDPPLPPIPDRLEHRVGDGSKQGIFLVFRFAPRAKLLEVPLPSCDGPITCEEVAAAIKRFKTKRVAVQVAAEYMKALVEAGAFNTDDWIVKLMALCREAKRAPTSWHVAQVAFVHKKGSPVECG